MKIAVIGSREFKDKNLIQNMMPEILRTSNDVLISGGARGVDSWAEAEAKLLGCKCLIFQADWERFGKQAGYLRNKEIINIADKVVAFWDGSSKGTKISIDLAIKAKKPIDIYVRQ